MRHDRIAALLKPVKSHLDTGRLVYPTVMAVIAGGLHAYWCRPSELPSTPAVWDGVERETWPVVITTFYQELRGLGDRVGGADTWLDHPVDSVWFDDRHCRDRTVVWLTREEDPWGPSCGYVDPTGRYWGVP